MKYPDLSRAKIVSIDIETYDPNIETMNTGVYRRDGYILGVSLATPEGFSEYYNIGHYDVTLEERNKNIAYLKRTLALPMPKLFANGMYDCDWLMYWTGSPELESRFRKGITQWEGINVNGTWYDVQLAEGLIDENKFKYNLDSLAVKYLKQTKVKGEIEAFCERNDLKGKAASWLYKMPSSLVRNYGIGDVTLPLEIFNLQEAILVNEELWDLFIMECDLVKTVLKMRNVGCRVDTKVRDVNALLLQNKIETHKIELQKEFPNKKNINVNSSQQLAALFDIRGLDYIRTEKGNPSIKNKHLQNFFDSDPWTLDVWNIRKGMKVRDSFLMGSYVEHLCENDLLHPSIYTTKIENVGGSGVNGAKSGRLAMAKPSLHQIPSKGKDNQLGLYARQPFIPFDDCWWGKIDYSQIEYRFTAHYAMGPGADQVRDSYISNPFTDYHKYIQDLTTLERSFAKNLNFGVAYGMGAKSMSEFFGWQLDYCYSILDIYHSKAPYIKYTSDRVQAVALRRGYIKTFLNRRAHLTDKKKAYTMYCRLISGSAADLMKKAMLDTDKAGLFNVLHPHITVHDELDVSIPKTKEGIEAFEEMDNIMKTSIKLKVPIMTEAEYGNNWAELEPFSKEEALRRI